MTGRSNNTHPFISCVYTSVVLSVSDDSQQLVMKIFRTQPDDTYPFIINNTQSFNQLLWSFGRNRDALTVSRFVAHNFD